MELFKIDKNIKQENHDDKVLKISELINKQMP